MSVVATFKAKKDNNLLCIYFKFMDYKSIDILEILQRIFLLLLQKHDETLPKIFRPIQLEKEYHRQKRHGQVRSFLQCAAVMSKKKEQVDDPCVNKGDCEQNLK